MRPALQVLLVAAAAFALRYLYFLKLDDIAVGGSPWARAGMLSVSACVAGAAALAGRRLVGAGAGWWAGLLLAVSWPAIVLAVEWSLATPLALLAVCAFTLPVPAEDRRASVYGRVVASLLALGALVAAVLALPEPLFESTLGDRIAGLVSADAYAADPWYACPLFERDRADWLLLEFLPGWKIVLAFALASLLVRGRGRIFPSLWIVVAIWAAWLAVGGVTVARALPLLALLTIPAGTALSVVSGSTGGAGAGRRCAVVGVAAALLVLSLFVPSRGGLPPHRLLEWGNSVRLVEECIDADKPAAAARWESLARARFDRIRHWPCDFRSGILLDEVRRRPDSVLLRTLLAETLFACNRDEEASAHLAIASNLDPTNRAARLMTAESLLRARRPGAALRRVEELERQFGSLPTLDLKIRCLEALGRDDEADALRAQGL